LKIGYLTQCYPALSHTFVQREVLALRRLGMDVTTYSIRSPREHDLLSEEDRRERAATEYVLPPKWRRLVRGHAATLFAHPLRYFGALALAVRISPPGLRNRLWALFYFAEAVYLASLFRRDGIDHVHVHFAMTNAMSALLACALARVPYSITVHGSSVFYKPREYSLAEKTSRAKFVVCISEFCRSQVMLLSPMEVWGRIHVVHCGVDADRFRPPEGGRTGAEGVALLSVARLTPGKGYTVLFDAMKKLARSGLELKLKLAGDGPAREMLMRYAVESDLADNVEFLGPVGQDDIGALYDEADIFVLPSFAEGLPVVLVEAMAKALPVVATRIAGIPELVDEGVSGLLVTPASSGELAGAIETLAKDEELRKKFGRAGREKVLAEFDSTQNARKLKRLFDRHADAG